MTLHRRILTFYSFTLVAAILVICFWSWFEFNEQRESVLRDGVKAAKAESPLVETLEILLAGGIPALLITLIGGHLLMKRALAPVTRLTEALENTEITNLAKPVPLRGNGDEIDRMARVFNDMKSRLGTSFTQAREFTLHASHELKTPLTILHGMLEQMLAQQTVAEGDREKLVSMIEEVQRLSYIVSQLAFLARADAGQMVLNREVVALDELVVDLSDETTLLAAPRGIRVLLEGCRPCVVLADRMRLRQLLLNLADNAVKHNREGGSVWMSLVEEDQEAVFSIRNTGPVLPPDQCPRVFERFFRGATAHTQGTEGSGLGLSIAQSILEAHHGSIVYSTLPEQQTRVQFTLPLAARQKAPASAGRQVEDSTDGQQPAA